MTRQLKHIIIFTFIISILSVAYFVYLQFNYPPIPENETFLSELGEWFGEIALWLIIFIYTRTILRLFLGKGALSRRLIPNHTPDIEFTFINKTLSWLDSTHIYFGISAVAIILIHIALLGIPMEILFFPAVLFLVVWQGVFGAFISWKRTSISITKFSYMVHAQLFTGITLGIFAYLGHLAIDK